MSHYNTNYVFFSGRYIFFLILPLLVSCKTGKKPGNDPGARNMTYQVLQLKPRNITTHLDFPATIQGQQVIEIRPKVDGYIEKIYVNEGAPVKKGQLLFRISNPQFEENVRTAEASIKIAEADVNTAQMNVNKVIPLVDKGIVSQYELQSAQYTLQSKQALLAQAKASLANAHTNLDYTIIRSPLDGVIGPIPFKIGALVNSNTTEPLTTLSDISKVDVYFSLDENQILNLSMNDPGVSLQKIFNRMPKPVLVLSDGTEYPDSGRLETASGLVSTQTGSVSVKAIFQNKEDLLRSGASAIIRLPQNIHNALVIPQSATYEIQDKRFVFIVDARDLVHNKLMSQVTPTDDGHFFIVKKGFQPGDRIVLSGIIGLRDSTKIQPQLVNTDSIYRTLEDEDQNKK